MELTTKKGFKGLFQQMDLTKGTVWKVILKFSLPIVLSYLLQQLYTIIDAAICGQTLNVNEVAGVNDTYALSFIFLQFAFGCTAGFSVILSNKVGEGNMSAARKSFATQIVLSSVVCVVLTVIGILCINPLLSLIGVAPSDNAGNQEVYRAAYTYIFIIYAGIAAQFFYNFICCILRGMGDSLTPLVFLFISTILNIILDLLFILVFHWGVAGAAVATVLAQLIATVGCFIYTFYHYKELRLHKEDFRFTRRFALDHLKQGLPLGLQFSVLAFGLLAMSNGVVLFDKTPDGVMVENMPAQNGFGAANKIINFMMTPFNALGTAMISYCGQNYGAKRQDRIRQGFNQSILLMLVFYVIFAGLGLLLSINGAYQYIFLSSDKITAESIKYGNLYLYADLPLFFFVGSLIVYRNAIQGLGISLYPFLAGIAELVSRIAICLTLPRLINGGAINSLASDASFFFLCFADPGAWIGANIILGFAAVKFVYSKPRKINLKEEKTL